MLIKEILDHEAEMIALRHDFHAHPELGFEEHRTSSIIAKLLTEWGYQVDRGLGQTGVVATLTQGDGRKRLGIRADMDALPMQELTDLPYASQYPGKMHACGHDGHCAILLSAAKYLAQTRRFSGTLHLIFQPSEESIGGARVMIEEGLFQRFPCDAVFGLHNFPLYPAGQFFTKPGPLMASSDSFTVTLYGKGGHGSAPEHCLDPLPCAATIVLALQTIVSRNVDPQIPAVVTVGSLQAGTTHNIIPDSVVMKINTRSFCPATRQKIEESIRHIVATQAESYHLTAKIEKIFGYPATINHPTETAFALQIARQTVGDEHVGDPEGLTPLMGSEDFAFMLQEVPGCYLLLGTGNDDRENFSVHHPRYQFNDQCLSIGASYWANLVEAYLV
ncbi:amidohydrolase [Rosenbergiella australiborealis]|uniref:Amidohydrolase n=1 Tax=Rosenbergiella australiborealis TaxID=1544696 RepID=A0ABS5T2W4_9GAMM|nr:M20 aminoacylase family protein [Rosenbergiella australiborealis]MBT0726676.1 amidohydrolase [Rosenbergiella australiborealis]